MTDNSDLPDWKFVPRHPMSKQRDPIQGEFFNTDSIESTADELVREAVQNTLDATSPGSRARVRIFVSEGEAALSPEAAEPWFAQFWEHATACADLSGVREEPCHFIVFEDFGTTGLRGDERAYSEPVDGEANDFFYFFRAEGKSGKSGADRGRWGVGKYVFPKASRVNAFFAFTKRDEPTSSAALLMGQAVLRNHALEDAEFEPDGWWCRINGEVPVPLYSDTEPDLVRTFCDTWHVSRRGESGLSVVVPYTAEELDVASLQRSVAHDYFVAVINGNLSVEVASPAGVTLIDAETLDDVIEGLDEETRGQLAADVELVRWSVEKEETPLTLSAPEGSPQWSGALVTEEQRNLLRSRLEAEERVHVRVPVSIKSHRTGDTKESHFDVLLAPERGHDRPALFVREGIMVSEVKTKRVRNTRAIVVAEDVGLARLLGDAEGPAHTNWSDKTERFKGQYLYGADWLRFVRAAPHRLVELARRGDEEEDRFLTADFFPRPADDGPSEPGSGKGKTKTDEPEPPTESRVPRYRVHQREGGFSVVLTDHGEEVTSMEVVVAYDRERGNPFKRWVESDFDLAGLPVDVEGASVRASANRLQIAVNDAPSFKVSVAGFDTNRDLRIKVTAESDT